MTPREKWSKIGSKTVEVTESWLVCELCACYIANGDATALDYWYSPEDADSTLKAMNGALERADGYAVLCGEYGITRTECDCCSRGHLCHKWNVSILKPPQFNQGEEQ